MLQRVATHDEPNVPAPGIGQQCLTRGRLLGLDAAAGLVATTTALAQAFAAWEATPPESLRGTVSLCAWLYESTRSREKRPKLLYDKYMRRHPGVKLRMVPEPSGDWNAWFLTRTIADPLPDLLNTPSAPYQDLHLTFFSPITRYLMKPNPYILGNKHWIDIFLKGWLRPFQAADGNYYGIDADATATWIHCNPEPEHLDRIGIKPPETWGEMLDAAARLKAKGITPCAQNGGPGWPITLWFMFTENSLWAAEFPPCTTLDVKSGCRHTGEACSRRPPPALMAPGSWSRSLAPTGGAGRSRRFL
jgi:ABC-type glycerol-3-phosphate transport system substrate-binding protein